MDTNAGMMLPTPRIDYHSGALATLGARRVGTGSGLLNRRGAESIATIATDGIPIRSGSPERRQRRSSFRDRANRLAGEVREHALPVPASVLAPAPPAVQVAVRTAPFSHAHGCSPRARARTRLTRPRVDRSAAAFAASACDHPTTEDHQP